ncbi:MAG: hypothetical protein IJZ64_08070 [Ruminococcus sp.]|nr:hypothetical protein [Ruminococcus sp.]
MWLRLDNEGLDFQFRIDGYISNLKADIDYESCYVRLHIGGFYEMNLDISGYDLYCDEVEHLSIKLSALLKGELIELEYIESLDSVYRFKLCPAGTEIATYSGVDKISDIMLEFILVLWANGAPTDNEFHLRFKRDDIEVMYTYLQYVQGHLNKNDKKIKDFISEGHLLPDYL